MTPYIAQQTVTDYGLRPAANKYSATLAATTDTLFTVPGMAPSYKALIKTPTSEVVWVALNAVAAAPAGAAFASTTSELLTGEMPLCREVKAGDVIHFYSTVGTADISISLFSLGSMN